MYLFLYIYDTKFSNLEYENLIMDSISYTNLRNNLSKIFDKVHDDHSPIMITRQKGSASVLISLEDYRVNEHVKLTHLRG
ncbi:MAG: prevent-host-death family protein [Paraglaciecola sp.]|jgi:prevent-host-death family protein